MPYRLQRAAGYCAAPAPPTRRTSYSGAVITVPIAAETLPLHSQTPLEWGRAVLTDPIALLIDHAFLEKKAATNALELLTRWPNDWMDGWVEALTAIAKDEVAHLAQVTRLLQR